MSDIIDDFPFAYTPDEFCNYGFCRCRGCVGCERDAAIARAEKAEAEIDDLEAELEAVGTRNVELHQAWMAKVESLTARAEEAEEKLRRFATESLTAEGQCIEEHHWAGNCPAEADAAFTRDQLLRAQDDYAALEAQLETERAKVARLTEAMEQVMRKLEYVETRVDRMLVPGKADDADRMEARWIPNECLAILDGALAFARDGGSSE